MQNNAESNEGIHGYAIFRITLKFCSKIQCVFSSGKHGKELCPIDRVQQDQKNSKQFTVFTKGQ